MFVFHPCFLKGCNSLFDIQWVVPFLHNGSNLNHQLRKDQKYWVIHKSLQDFRPLRYCSRDCHAEGELVNRGRDTPSFCPTLQVLDMPTLGDEADVNPVIKFLPHTLHVCGRNLITGLTSVVSPRVDIEHL